MVEGRREESEHDNEWVNPAAVAADVQEVIQGGKRGPKPDNIQQLWTVYEQVEDRVNSGASLEELKAAYPEANDPRNAVHDSVRRLNNALEGVGSDYELHRTSIYFFRRRKKN